MADQLHAVGRRKEAVCRVYIKPGSGKWEINGRTIGDYFPRPALVSSIQLPFSSTDNLGKWDVTANIDGGGTTGQAGAPRPPIPRPPLQFAEADWPPPPGAGPARPHTSPESRAGAGASWSGGARRRRRRTNQTTRRNTLQCPRPRPTAR